MGLFERMDRAAFLGLDVWSFSVRSLSQAYGKEFLLRAVLRHPLRVLAGLWRYRSAVRPARGVGIAPVGGRG
jgi:aminoglycoside phosphotransferase family enzyme